MLTNRCSVVCKFCNTGIIAFMYMADTNIIHLRCCNLSSFNIHTDFYTIANESMPCRVDDLSLNHNMVPLT